MYLHTYIHTYVHTYIQPYMRTCEHAATEQLGQKTRRQDFCRRYTQKVCKYPNSKRFQKVHGTFAYVSDRHSPYVHTYMHTYILHTIHTHMPNACVLTVHAQARTVHATVHAAVHALYSTCRLHACTVKTHA